MPDRTEFLVLVRSRSDDVPISLYEDKGEAIDAAKKVTLKDVDRVTDRIGGGVTEIEYISVVRFRNGLPDSGGASVEENGAVRVFKDPEAA